MAERTLNWSVGLAMGDWISVLHFLMTSDDLGVREEMEEVEEEVMMF
jgi:hypothetical protein